MWAKLTPSGDPGLVWGQVPPHAPAEATMEPSSRPGGGTDGCSWGLVLEPATPSTQLPRAGRVSAPSKAQHHRVHSLGFTAALDGVSWGLRGFQLLHNFGGVSEKGSKRVFQGRFPNLFVPTSTGFSRCNTGQPRGAEGPNCMSCISLPFRCLPAPELAGPGGMPQGCRSDPCLVTGSSLSSLN